MENNTLFVQNHKLLSLADKDSFLSTLKVDWGSSVVEKFDSLSELGLQHQDDESEIIILTARLQDESNTEKGDLEFLYNNKNNQEAKLNYNLELDSSKVFDFKNKLLKSKSFYNLAQHVFDNDGEIDVENIKGLKQITYRPDSDIPSILEYLVVPIIKDQNEVGAILMNHRTDEPLLVMDGQYLLDKDGVVTISNDSCSLTVADCLKNCFCPTSNCAIDLFSCLGACCLCIYSRRTLCGSCYACAANAIDCASICAYV